MAKEPLEGAPRIPALDKVCARCLQRKPLNDFWLVRRGKPARRADCKICCEAERREAINRDPEEYRREATDRRARWRNLDLDAQRAKGREMYHASMRDPVRAEKIKASRRTPEYRAAGKAWREANPEMVVFYSRRTLCRKHGMTIAQYQLLLSTQGGACAICRNPPEAGRSLCIDHDHTCCAGSYSCGQCVRGLLCVKCNRAVGGFRDDPTILRNAIAYMEKRP